MAIRFLDPKNTSVFQDILNSDPEFKIAARYVTKETCIEVDNSGGIVKFRDLVVTQIKSEDVFADLWDFTVKGSVGAREKFLQPFPPRFYDGIFGGIVRGNFRIAGDTVIAFCHFCNYPRVG